VSITRLSVDGYGSRRAGSFSGREEAARPDFQTLTRLSVDGYGVQRNSSFSGRGEAEHNITGAGGIASLAAVGAPTVEAVFPQVLGGGAPWTRPAPLLAPLPWFVHGAGGIASRAAVGVPTVTWRRVTRARRESELLLFAKAA
jgi:hypothetical protein